MSDQRRVYRVGNSWVVPVPRRLRAALGRLEGGDIYWHYGRGGEAVVSANAQRIGGRPPGLGLQKEVDRLRRENTRLRRRLQARPIAARHEQEAAIYEQAIGVAFRELPWVADLFARLDRIEAWMPQRARRRRRAVVAAGDVTHVHAPDECPSPSPFSSAAVLDGGDAASGAAPPGRPAEHSAAPTVPAASHL